MSTVRNLETKLDEVVNTKAPQLPIGIKRFLFEWSPWIALVVGILSLLAALGLWSSARGIHDSAYVIRQLCSTYRDSTGGCDIKSISHLGFWVWLAVIFLIIQGILYLRAYPRLQERQKSGWDFLYYASLTSVVYTVITLLTGFDVVGHFISAVIGVAVSFYLLFQIRPLFTDLEPAAEVQIYAIAPTVTSRTESKSKPKPKPKAKSTAKKKPARAKTPKKKS